MFSFVGLDAVGAEEILIIILNILHQQELTHEVTAPDERHSQFTDSIHRLDTSKQHCKRV